MRHTLLALPLAVVAVVLAARLGSSPAAPPPPSGRPALVVILVVDQMRADYVLKYGHQWTAGLRRLIDGGAWFQQALYPYSYTVTCAGHATISTGALPRTHGIVGNGWWDRATGTPVACADDPDVQTVSYGAPIKGARGPRQLASTTFTDELRAQTDVAPRVVTFSMKERTAIMLAGHRADAVTWFDAGAGTFATSTAYTSSPVPFVQRALAARPVESDFATPWSLGKPSGFYSFSDAAEGERAPAFWGTSFPHPLSGGAMTAGQRYEAWEESPYSDAYLERLGEAAVADLRLGQGPGTDVLAISFSALDLVGHDFGPSSYEVQEVLLRLDLALGRLFDALDRSVGRGRYTVALTGDHGVSPIPEQLALLGNPAGRTTSAKIAQAVQEVFDVPLDKATAVKATANNQLYLTDAAREALGHQAALHDQLTAALAQVPGVARVFFADQRSSWSDADPIARAVANSYYPARGGDIVVVLKPYWLVGNGSAASHGTPYRYDTWVPLFFYGSGIRPGRYTQAVTPADLAPTLGWLCGVTLSHADGRPLLEATATTSPIGPNSSS